MLSKEQLFELMNLPRAARRRYKKQYGVKIPGIQDNPHGIPKHIRGENNRNATASSNAEDVRATEGQMPVHESSADAVYR